MAYEFYLWYNPQDKNYYSRAHDNFNGFCISGHLAAYYGNAFSAILNETLKSYYIDPETVAFQTYDIDMFFNDKGGLRFSWKKYLDLLPPQIKAIISSRRPLTPRDLLNSRNEPTDLIDELIVKVIQFQKRSIEDKISGLIYFMDTQPELKFIVAPYFYFNSLEDEWYTINREILSKIIDVDCDVPKYAVLCFNKNILLENENIEQLSNDYIQEGIDGYLIWINNFRETNEERIYLDNLLKLIYNLSRNNKKIINMYGGYFSVLASFWGLFGHVSGVNTRESRDVVQKRIDFGPPGGPTPRYYIPNLHTRVEIDHGVRLMRQFPELRCYCDICQANSNAFDPNTEKKVARKIMNEHFLNVRKNEIQQIYNNNYMNIFIEIERMSQQYQYHSTVMPSSHLEKWDYAIKQNVNLL